MPLAGTPAPSKRKRSSRIIIKKTVKDAGAEINLGKKISIPRDVMLEELSLLKNKGSQMFKERQRRVERFVYESHPDVFNPDSMDNFQKFIPGSGGVLKTGPGGIQVIGEVNSKFQSGYHHSGTHSKGTAPAPYPKPQHLAAVSGIIGKQGSGQGDRGSKGAGGPEGSGVQGEGDDKKGAGGGGGKKYTSIIKTYVSPWEQAMGNDLELKSSMSLHMESPGAAPKLHAYKCFNRSSTAVSPDLGRAASGTTTFQGTSTGSYCLTVLPHSPHAALDCLQNGSGGNFCIEDPRGQNSRWRSPYLAAEISMVTYSEEGANSEGQQSSRALHPIPTEREKSWRGPCRVGNYNSKPGSSSGLSNQRLHNRPQESGFWEPIIRSGIHEGADGKQGSRSASGADGFLLTLGI